MQCPSCGNEMEERIYDEIVTYGGESIVLTEMRGEICPQCGEIVWDDMSYDRFFEAQDTLVMNARNKVKNGERLFNGNTDQFGM